MPLQVGQAPSLHVAVDAHAVAPEPAGPAARARAPAAVIGQQQQPLGVDVQPADRHQPRQPSGSTSNTVGALPGRGWWSPRPPAVEQKQRVRSIAGISVSSRWMDIRSRNVEGGRGQHLPLTLMRPAAISSSASRREAMPARASRWRCVRRFRLPPARARTRLEAAFPVRRARKIAFGAVEAPLPARRRAGRGADAPRAAGLCGRAGRPASLAARRAVRTVFPGTAAIVEIALGAVEAPLPLLAGRAVRGRDAPRAAGLCGKAYRRLSSARGGRSGGLPGTAAILEIALGTVEAPLPLLAGGPSRSGRSPRGGPLRNGRSPALPRRATGGRTVFPERLRFSKSRLGRVEAPLPLLAGGPSRSGRSPRGGPLRKGPVARLSLGAQRPVGTVFPCPVVAAEIALRSFAFPGLVARALEKRLLGKRLAVAGSGPAGFAAGPAPARRSAWSAAGAEISCRRRSCGLCRLRG